MQFSQEIEREFQNCVHVIGPRAPHFYFAHAFSGTFFLRSYKIARHVHDLTGHLVKKRDCSAKSGGNVGGFVTIRMHVVRD